MSNTPIGITGYPALSEIETMSMTVEEALQRAADLEKQGCITPTAQALLALANELRKAHESGNWLPPNQRG